MATAEVTGLNDKKDDKKDDKEPDKDDGSMTLWEHLEELRGRIVKMLLAFLAGAIGGWIYKEKILAWLTLPFKEAWKGGQHSETAALHFSAPTDLFVSYIRLSALAGLVFALPLILYQIWAFVAPGLYSKEKRFAIPFVGSSVLLFGVGGYFGWKYAFPAAFNFLLNFAQPAAGSLPGVEVKPTVMMADYIEFVTKMFVAFGACAELPVLSFFLTVAGIITHRQLIKFFRYFIVIAFVISAIVTPPDPLSQIMLAVPLIGLYGVSIGVSWIFTRAREARLKEESIEAKPSGDDKKP
jgi:sec-independent protein translocase protein TatC